MVAARRFGDLLDHAGQSSRVASLTVDLYGSLALTGKGHATDSAVILGLMGERPESVDVNAVSGWVADVQQQQRISLWCGHTITFDPAAAIRFHQREKQPFHSNALAFEAHDAAGSLLARRMYYSVGGGFVVDEDEAKSNARSPLTTAIPHDFETGQHLLDLCDQTGCSIADLMLANECALRPLADVEAGIGAIASAMMASIDRGCQQDGILPGGLKVKRRAPAIAAELRARQEASLNEPLGTLDWINLWAMAVNEENAAGGRVVTAPTNGAAGIIPAVLRYYERCYRGDAAGRQRFLLTAAAIGALYKRNASISGAEMGCQGEVGVACSMAAAGLTAALGGSNAQIENAAEIGMEHNLGLTCDPVGGLVQIPCIERNAMGAVKAIDASRLALMGDGSHMVSLDKVIETMRQTGQDMHDKYKETSQGGLAVNVVAC